MSEALDELKAIGLHMHATSKALNKAIREIERLEAENRYLRQTVEFVASWAWRADPPNASRHLTDEERLSAIKYYPAIKEMK
jgi:hypothetical protein